MATNNIFDPAAAAKLKALFAGATQAALDAVWAELRRQGQEYRRQVARVTPVEYGTLKQSWQVAEERTADKMEVTVGTNVPYAVFLEFGTARIAGGKVQDWQEGDAPITNWAAKLKGLHGADQQLRAMAMAPGRGEQMPMLRTVGHDMAPGIVAALNKAADDGFAAGLAGAKP